jgi:hypothetical protein
MQSNGDERICAIHRVMTRKRKMHTHQFIQIMVAQRDVRELPFPIAHAVMAMRLCVVCHTFDRDPKDDLIQRLGSPLAAQKFHIAVEAIGTAWPEPFSVARPCCPKLSPDEATLVDMITAVRANNRADFDKATQEMLGCDARNTLYGALCAFETARNIPFA